MPDLALAGGHCKVCGEPTHEVVLQRPLDAAKLPGWPMKFGKRLPGTAKVSILLTDGSWADIVLHTACVPEGPEALVALWDRVLASTAHEVDNYWDLKLMARVEGEKSDQIDAAVARNASKIAGLTPLEVVTINARD